MIREYGLLPTYFLLLISTYLFAIISYTIIKGREGLITHAAFCAVVAPFIVIVWLKLVGVY